jgi:hypothetical protein
MAVWCPTAGLIRGVLIADVQSLGILDEDIDGMVDCGEDHAEFGSGAERLLFWDIAQELGLSAAAGQYRRFIKRSPSRRELDPPAMSVSLAAAALSEAPIG